MDVLIVESPKPAVSKGLANSGYQEPNLEKAKDTKINLNELQSSIMLAVLALSLALSAFAAGRSAGGRRRQ
jgi:hypothetical protein